MRENYDRSRLPAPTAYLKGMGLIADSPRGHWAAILCPIHKNGQEANPSLRVNLADGHFRCMSCGVKGGDVLALHRILTGAGFIQAARELGALQ